MEQPDLNHELLINCQANKPTTNDDATRYINRRAKQRKSVNIMQISSSLPTAGRLSVAVSRSTFILLLLVGSSFSFFSCT